MNEKRNIAIAKKLLEGIATGRDPDTIAASFDNDLVFEIQDETEPSDGADRPLVGSPGSKA